MGDNVVEFYVYNIISDGIELEYELSDHPHIKIDTTKSKPIQSFSFIITELKSKKII